MDISNIRDWFAEHNDILVIVGVFSFSSAILIIAAVVILINLIPPDFFLKERKTVIPPRYSSYFSPVVTAVIIKNILGLFLFIFGLLMLFLPGQGLLTIFISLLLIDFPGKWKLIQYFIRKKKVISVMNWVRHRFGQASLLLPS